MFITFLPRANRIEVSRCSEIWIPMDVPPACKNNPSLLVSFKLPTYLPAGECRKCPHIASHELKDECALGLEL